MKKIEDIDQPQARADYVAEYILEQLGDEHSEAFYRLVATKIPESVIRTAIAEVKTDDAREPAKLFTYKMKSYVLRRLKTSPLAEQSAP